MVNRDSASVVDFHIIICSHLDNTLLRRHLGGQLGGGVYEQNVHNRYLRLAFSG